MIEETLALMLKNIMPQNNLVQLNDGSLDIMVLNENGENCSALKASRGLGVEGMGTPCSNNNTHLRGDDICLFSSPQSLLLNYFSYFVYINCFRCSPPSPKYE